jgi:hypothetical protein
MFPLPGQVTLQFAGGLVEGGELRATESHEASAKGLLDELAFLAPHFAAIRGARP